MKSPYTNEMGELRLIVLMETEDRKSFRQVLVNADQFKNISDNTGTKVKAEDELKDGYETFETYFKPDWEIDAEQFLGCTSIDVDNF
jgi:hypothetical protein